MDQVKYSKACTEVVAVLENMPKEYYDKIPYEKICFYKYMMDIDYTYDYDSEYKNLSEYAVGILMNLYRDYWATEEKRKQILEQEAKERIEIEEKKKEKYNPNNIFENTTKISEQDTTSEGFEQFIENDIQNNENKNLEPVKKQNIIQKIIGKIKSIIFKGKNQLTNHKNPVKIKNIVNKINALKQKKIFGKFTENLANGESQRLKKYYIFTTEQIN